MESTLRGDHDSETLVKKAEQAVYRCGHGLLEPASRLGKGPRSMNRSRRS